MLKKDNITKEEGSLELPDMNFVTTSSIDSYEQIKKTVHSGFSVKQPNNIKKIDVSKFKICDPVLTNNSYDQILTNEEKQKALEEKNEFEKYIDYMLETVPYRQGLLLKYDSNFREKDFKYKFAAGEKILSEKTEFDDEVLKVVDTSTLGNVIPIHAPVMGGCVKNLILRDYFFSELRDNNLKLKKFSDSETKRLKSLFYLYEEQVERLFLENKKNDKPITPALFYTDYDKRREIVVDHIGVITRHFLDTKEDYVFPMTEHQKDVLDFECCVKNRKKENDLFYIFVNMITNYSTLEELEENPSFPPSINRLKMK